MTSKHAALIEPIRDASRKMVRELGFMRPTLANTNFSPSAVHAIVEIGAQGSMTASELSSILHLEKSTISRMLRKLIKAGELLETVDKKDTRVKRLSLTRKGVVSLSKINNFARKQVAEALEPLSAEKASKVLEGLSTYAKQLEASQSQCSAVKHGVVTEASDARSPDLGELVAALDEFLNRVCGAERNHGSPIERLAQDDTQMFVARCAGKAVGCAGLQVFDDGSAEVKRMYVLPNFQGKGIGRQLLERVEEAARASKVEVLRLETTELLTEAQALYRASGFVPCQAYGPYTKNPINLYFEKFLSGT